MRWFVLISDFVDVSRHSPRVRVLDDLVKILLQDANAVAGQVVGRVKWNWIRNEANKIKTDGMQQFTFGMGDVLRIDNEFRKFLPAVLTLRRLEVGKAVLL